MLASCLREGEAHLEGTQVTAHGKTASPGVVWMAAYISGVSFLFGNAQPVILGAMADGLSLGVAQVGFITSAFMLCSGLVKLFAPLWIRRVSMRSVTLISLFLAGLVFSTCAFATSFGHALAALAVYGLFEGIFGTTSFAALGDGEDPAKGYAYGIGAQMVMAAAFIILATQWTGPAFGFAGVMLTIALFVFSGVLPGMFFPRSTYDNVEEGFPLSQCLRRWRELVPFFVSAVAAILFLASIMAIWTFTERFANSVNIDLKFVGLVVMIASLLTAVAAFVASGLSKLGKPVVVTSTGILILLASLAIIAQGTHWTFAAGVSLFSFGWGLTHPFYFGILRQTDITHRLFTSVPAIMNIGIAVGVAIGGIVYASHGFASLLAISAGSLLCSLIFIGWAARRVSGPSLTDIAEARNA